MSLAPPTDLVLEVSRAADPARAAAVADRLNALAAKGAASPADFATTLSAAGASTAQKSVPLAHAGRPASRAQTAQTKLESVILSEFIGEMLPKDTPSAFGQGYAGDMWRSMLAERVADQIAASGRLGIAARLFASHPLPSGSHLLSTDRLRGLTQADAAQAGASDADLFAQATPL
jgi:flagellar protein FlgJ